MGLFQKIKDGLSKTRTSLMTNVENVLKSFTGISDDLYDELEETLILADIGAATAQRIIEEVKQTVKRNKVVDAQAVKDILKDTISGILTAGETEINITPPAVILIIGVNGAGKTTSIGKLAHYFTNEGRSVLLAAADTFRAAAIDQLEVWGTRAGTAVIRHQEHSDPGAVIFDAIAAAKARKTDILICDTAGRLQNKKNLMDELNKIYRIITREYPEAAREVFLVLDATTGQNALQQARLFVEIADVTGIILTKLDGTAKGGIVIAIKDELNLPVRFVGVGEGIDDLQPFDAKDFAAALFES